MDAAVSDRDGMLGHQRQTARLIGRVRWAGVALGIVQAVLTSNPAPIGGAIAIMVPGLVMAAYNLPIAGLRRVPSRWVEPVVIGALVGDFLVVTATGKSGTQGLMAVDRSLNRIL